MKLNDAKAGLQLRRMKGNYLKVNQLELADAEWQDCGTVENLNKMKVSQPDDAATLRGANNYAAIAEGYINIPEDGVYYLSSRMEQVWIDNKLVINNEGAVKAGTNSDNSVALAKGLHPVKFVQYRRWLAIMVEQPYSRNAQGQPEEVYRRSWNSVFPLISDNKS